MTDERYVRLNQADVVFILSILRGKQGIEEMLDQLKALIIDEQQEEWPDFKLLRFPVLDLTLKKLLQQYYNLFVFVRFL